MNRREFFKESLKYMGGAFSAYLLGKNIPISGSPRLSDKMPDLVAVKGGEPDVLFDKAIASIGGMGQFVKKGQKVVIKPNIGWSVSPERAANTNPKLVKRIVEHCIAAGAKKVYVFDNSSNHWEDCYRLSGIGQSVKEGGGVMVPANKESYYHEVRIPGAKNLKTTKVHELFLEADVFINVPILKDHGSAELTISMKNLMGVVWDRWYYHGNGLHQCIADFCLLRKPTLNVVDAYAVMTRNGPRGSSSKDVDIRKMLIISTDIVAADSAACRILNKTPQDVKYIQKAYEMRIGNMNLEQLNIQRIVL